MNICNDTSEMVKSDAILDVKEGQLYQMNQDHPSYQHSGDYIYLGARKSSTPMLVNMASGYARAIIKPYPRALTDEREHMWNNITKDYCLQRVSK